ncbi:hypothetical protein, partial [Enterobacter hormaechei]|uniref:hypothetical protein n=1 Tax=Enterobacter hormaechei TaxID=158836 RepID=UPI001CC32248
AKSTSSIFNQRSNHYKAHLRVGLIMVVAISGTISSGNSCNKALLNGIQNYPNDSLIKGVRLMKILWAICVVFGAIGFVQGIVGVFGAVSAPQQAAGAAMGVAWAVIPYCIVRAIQQMRPQEVVIKKED